MRKVAFNSGGLGDAAAAPPINAQAAACCALSTWQYITSPSCWPYPATCGGMFSDQTLYANYPNMPVSTVAPMAAPASTTPGSEYEGTINPNTDQPYTAGEAAAQAVQDVSNDQITATQSNVQAFFGGLTTSPCALTDGPMCEDSCSNVIGISCPWSLAIGLTAIFLIWALK